MEKSLKEFFQMKEVDIREYSPLTLAYIGDAIYELIIRSIVVNRGNKQVNKLHQETSFLVQAQTQSKMMRVIQEVLTDDERGVYKRGRNAKSVSPAKNQTITDYRRATGFEALCGYLYLQNQMDRLMEIIKLGLDNLDREE